MSSYDPVTVVNFTQQRRPDERIVVPDSDP